MTSAAYSDAWLGGSLLDAELQLLTSELLLALQPLSPPPSHMALPAMQPQYALMPALSTSCMPFDTIMPGPGTSAPCMHMPFDTIMMAALLSPPPTPRTGTHGPQDIDLSLFGPTSAGDFTQRLGLLGDTKPLAAVPASEMCLQALPIAKLECPPTPAATPSSPGSASQSDASSSDGRSCANCQATETTMWRRGHDGANTLCNACGTYLRTHHRHRPIIPPATYAQAGQAVCANCGTSETSIWRTQRRPDGPRRVCNACALYQRVHGCPRPANLRRNTRVFRRQRRGRLTANTPRATQRLAPGPAPAPTVWSF